MAKNSRRSSKTTNAKKRIKRILSLFLVFAAASGFVKGATSKRHSEGKTPTVASTLAALNETERQGISYLSQPFQHQEQAPAPETSRPVIRVVKSVRSIPATQPASVLDNAAAVMENSTSNQLFRILQPLAPEGTSTNQLWLYTSTLQKLSTDTNNVCTATNMPSTNFVHFIQMVKNIPTNELEKVVSGASTYFDFTPVKKAFKNPSNTFNFAQTTFEQQSRYQLFDKMQTELPNYEGDKDFMYWDSATKSEVVNGVTNSIPNNQPTLHIGLNLLAHPDLIPQIRFKNSDTVQQIIESDPKKRTDEEYIHFTKDSLMTLTEYVRQHYPTHKADSFQELFGLSIHPDDRKILDDYYKDLVAKKIVQSEAALMAAATTNFTDHSVLFGSYTNPIPLCAQAVPVDIAYNVGSLTNWPKFKTAFVERDWDVAIRESIPASGKPVERCHWRQTSLRNAKSLYLAAQRRRANQQQPLLRR